MIKLMLSILVFVTVMPGFHIIAPVATIAAVVEKSVLAQTYFLSDASDRVFPYIIAAVARLHDREFFYR